jgi:hypothetical protein
MRHAPFLSISAVFLTVILTGCTQQPRTSAADEPGQADADALPGVSAKDPCPTQLHDLAEPLLMYYSLNKRLPKTLEQLQSVAGPDPKYAWTCPDSKQPYIYNPAGIYWPDIPGRAILYDAQPSHAGMRWTITVEPPRPGQALVTRVLAVPNSRFPVNP